MSGRLNLDGFNIHQSPLHGEYFFSEYRKASEASTRLSTHTAVECDLASFSLKLGVTCVLVFFGEVVKVEGFWAFGIHGMEYHFRKAHLYI